MIACITTEDVNSLKAALRRGEFDIGKMLTMPTTDRRALFEKYLSKEVAQFVNKNFERAMVSSRKTALKEWAEKTFKAKEPKKYKDITERINEINELLPEKGQLSLIEDFVSQKLGVTVTAEEVEKITEMSKKLESLANDKTEFNTPTEEYLTQLNEMMDYINSITPSSNLKVFSKIVSKGALLFSAKSTITNVVGNTAISGSEAAARRISGNTYKGLNADYAMKFFKHNINLFKNTGYDLSRMESLADGQRILGEEATTTKGKGLIRATGRFYENTIFKWGLGMPDVAFATAHFVDSINLNTTKLAYQEGLKGDNAKARALEIFKDATSLEPSTKEGQAVREKAIIDAKRATFSDKTRASKIASGARKFLNTIGGAVHGDLALGDWFVPFAQVPANVVARAAEAAGLTTPWDLRNLYLGFKNNDLEKLNSAIRALTNTGFAWVGSFLLSMLIDDEDFIGEYADYNESERELLKLKGAAYDSIRIGSKWYSLDYFGSFAAPLVGILSARKYGNGAIDTIGKYFLSMGKQLKRIPGYNELGSLFKKTDDDFDMEKNSMELAKDAAIGLVDFVSTRIIPSILSDVAKSIDDYERDTKASGSLGQLGRNLQAKIPFAREALPEKINMFGEKVATQGYKTLFFGARLKQGQSNPVIDELNRLSANGNLPSIGDIRKTSQRVKELRDQIGTEAFKNAITFFGKNFHDRLDELISDPSYSQYSDEEKKDMIERIKSEELKSMLMVASYGEEQLITLNP